MKCAGCNNTAKYMLHEDLQPHCQLHFEEAIENCTVPTIILTTEVYEEGKRNVGQSKAS